MHNWLWVPECSARSPTHVQLATLTRLFNFTRTEREMIKRCAGWYRRVVALAVTPRGILRRGTATLIHVCTPEVDNGCLPRWTRGLYRRSLAYRATKPFIKSAEKDARIERTNSVRNRTIPLNANEKKNQEIRIYCFKFKSRTKFK